MGCSSSKVPDERLTGARWGEKEKTRKPEPVASVDEVDLKAPDAQDSDPEFLKVFGLFARLDVDRSGSVDKEELCAAIDASDKLRKRLCKAAGYWQQAKTIDVVNAIFASADANRDGTLQSHELELVVRGWAAQDYERMAPEEAKQAAERNRLAGARARAEQRRIEGGGYAGITDAEEAREIGEAAQRVQDAERNVFGTEGGPDKPGSGGSGGGAPPDAREFDRLSPEEASRAAEQKRLAGAAERAKQKRVDGGGFAGLTDAEEARAIGEAAQQTTAAERAVFANESGPGPAAEEGAFSALSPEERAKAAEEKRLAGAAERAANKEAELGGFTGLGAEEALKAGEEVKLGGEVVEVGAGEEEELDRESGDGAGKKKKKKLRKMPSALQRRLREKGKNK
jgi:hypothetical protein